MMKSYAVFAVVGLSLMAVVQAQDAAAPFIYETPREFYSSADLDGDGRADLVIVDKESGKYRLGYHQAAGGFHWVDCRPSGMKGLTGFSLGKVLADAPEALVFTSPDANEITAVGAASATAPTRPVIVPFTAALGPNVICALKIGGAGPGALADFFVGSIYNSPDANLATWLRNDGADYEKISETPLPGVASRANRVVIGGRELLFLMLAGDQGESLRLDRLAEGKLVTEASVSGLAGGSEYVVGHFGAGPQLLTYTPGQNSFTARALRERDGQAQLAEPAAYDLGQPVLRLTALGSAGAARLLAIFGEGKTAGVFNFDGGRAPVLAQTLAATNDLFTCALSQPDGFIIFTQPPGGKFATKYQIYNSSGSGWTPGAFGGLPSLADNDNLTIPDIHTRIVAGLTVTNEADMRAYTNQIPGTRVQFVMLPIPGGEFVMGSPANEADRQPDEGPRHKVKISPFWMARCEITWNEYELFMYPEEERRMRATLPTDAGGDKLADAVTHPSQPYVEMSFGMGKDGYPAIAMTQHAANKYCQWLSAKTGQFYRLPTEAEWEYACRAGTTTAHFFGEDAGQLGDYAWYEENSDFKYQKVGRKKPNPWGLHDMYGNVVEWVLDQYDPEYYQQCAEQSLMIDPWNKATKPYPHAVRGGSWDDEAKMCRSAARRGSDRSWKMQDPQLPKSVWYFSDAQFVGFRIVRPLTVPPPEQMQKYWSSGVERD